MAYAGFTQALARIALSLVQAVSWELTVAHSEGPQSSWSIPRPQVNQKPLRARNKFGPLASLVKLDGDRLSFTDVELRRAES